ncbi:CLUMA_CG018435, isoform A [Clunio marinus]|uniref:CLUMA_CG018435, isoform A n=1 Tax=Clunio marinus TaxID=568069 RepID=A0A1J1J170_9DIPT|nr:CLUMA_CG018435, isoform A [Clunio marinus]
MEEKLNLHRQPKHQKFSLWHQVKRETNIRQTNHKFATQSSTVSWTTHELGNLSIPGKFTWKTPNNL